MLDDGTTLLQNVPSTALLELEKRAGEMQELLSAVPTLDPAKGFVPDPDRGQQIFRAREVRKARTKETRHHVVVPPTEHHPAQVAVVNEDVVVGQIHEQEWSGMITPARKAELIARAEELRRAVKAALHRANAVELPATLPVCGKILFDYVLGNGRR